VPARTSIVIPAHNESNRLATGFRRLAPVLEEMDPSVTEVIVIDDGSIDDTLHVAHDLYGHLPSALFVQQPTNLGKGAAVRLGIALATGEYVIAADADMSIDPRHFPEIVGALATSNLVPGSRVVRGHIQYDSALRTMAGGVFSRLVRHYTGTTLRDTQCGCKGYQRGPARILGLLGMINGYAADAEMLFLANQLGLSVNSIHVTWDDVEGSHVRIGRDSLAMVHELRARSRARYVNPVVEFAPDVDASAIGEAAHQARVQGLVVARGARDALLVLPREGSLAGLSIATALGGTLATAGLNELRARSYEAV
jgi:dolichyl-phosphate beta-glucosyltransferase